MGSQSRGSSSSLVPLLQPGPQLSMITELAQVKSPLNRKERGTFLFSQLTKTPPHEHQACHVPAVLPKGQGLSVVPCFSGQ